jgi:hypothetical protein
MNDSTKAELEDDIQKVKSGKLERFGDRLFLGGREEMTQFLTNLTTSVDSFLGRSK